VSSAGDVPTRVLSTSLINGLSGAHLDQSVATNHTRPPNISALIANSASELRQKALASSGLAGLDHPPGASSSSVTRCPSMAHPLKSSAGANAHRHHDTPLSNAKRLPRQDARKIPRTIRAPTFIGAYNVPDQPPRAVRVKVALYLSWSAASGCYAVIGAFAGLRLSIVKLNPRLTATTTKTAPVNTPGK
jgi:hypothetical protein